MSKTMFLYEAIVVPYTMISTPFPLACDIWINSLYRPVRLLCSSSTDFLILSAVIEVRSGWLQSYKNKQERPDMTVRSNSVFYFKFYKMLFLKEEKQIPQVKWFIQLCWNFNGVFSSP